MEKKRVLVLNYEYPPLGSGGGVVTKEIVEALTLGDDFIIDVVTMGYDRLPAHEVSNPSLHIYRVRSWRSRKDICHPWEQVTYLISAYCTVRKLLSKHTYDVCHAHFIIPTGPLAYFLKWQYKLPYIITAHGSDVLGYNERFKFLYPLLVYPWRKVLGAAKVVTSPSHFLAREIQKQHPILEPAKIKVVKNGIAADKFTPLPKQKYFLYVGRLVEAKGVQDIIEALHTLELGDWHFKIVGTGPYQPELEALVKKTGLTSKVEFLGRIANDSPAMQKLYGEARIFILASWFENMSISLLEALQAGCLVVASNVGGNPEIVSPDSLFTARNIEQLRQLISEKMKAETVPESVTANDWSNVIPAYVALLRS